MKSTRLPKLMVLFLLTAISVGVKAQMLVVHESLVSDKANPTPKVKPLIDMNKYQLIRDEGNQKIYVPKRNNVSRQKAETEKVKVTCQFEYDPSSYFPLSVVDVLSENYKGEFYDFDFETGTMAPPNTVYCTIPIGIHDFLTYGRTSSNGMAHVIKEQVNIKRDTTLVFNFADAKNQFNVETYKPNGELCQEWIFDYSEGEQKVIKEANINAFNDFFMLNLKGVGPIAINTVTSNVYEYGMLPSYTMFINDLSDRYRLTLARSVNADDTWYIYKSETDNLTSGMTLKNDPANFQCYEEQFDTSFLGKTNNEEDNLGVNMMGGIVSVDNVAIGELNGESELKAVDGTVKLYVDAPKSEELGQGHIDVMPYAGLGKRVEITYVWEEVEETYTEVVTYPILGLPVVLSTNGVEYVNASHDQGGNISFHVPEEGNMMAYPGNPAFGFNDKQKSLPYGTGCPINAFMSQNYFNKDINCFVGNFVFCYIGRYGEVRLVDMLNLKAEVSYNGKVICNNYGTHDRDMYNFFMERNTDGVIDAEFINENVVVDELPGKNITNVHYNWGAEDMTAPTLQMLWFKNQDNNVIDRFDTGANGTLEFAGGDFNFHMLPDKYFFDCKEQTVQVGYSPYNKNEWAALEVEEVPENFYMPGFGYFYRGSLKDVTGAGEKGWFDLKIRLEDAAGNWQEQVISPAFRIDDLVDTGIGNNNQYTITNNNAVYDLMGRRMESQQKGISIVRRANGDVRKVVVK